MPKLLTPSLECAYQISPTSSGIKGKVKEKVKQVSIETKQHVDAALATVRGQPWSEPLGKACSVTGGIVKAIGNFVPGFGILGGALSLGSKLLNPKATRNDLERSISNTSDFSNNLFGRKSEISRT